MSRETYVFAYNVFFLVLGRLHVHDTEILLRLSIVITLELVFFWSVNGCGVVLLALEAISSSLISQIL